MNKVTVQIINGSKFDLPKYETAQAAGMDVRGDFSLFEQALIGDPIGYGCAVSNTSDEGWPIEIYVPAHARILIPTGLKIALPVGYEMQVRPRSGLAIKQGIALANCVGTIDADYIGDCGIALTNNSNEPIHIKHGERLCQWVLSEVPQVEWEETDELPETDRGEGGFGHTGKN